MTGTPKTQATMIEDLRTFFRTGQTRDLDYRITQLKTLDKMVTGHEQDIMAALKSDLNKSGAEAFMTEINFVRHEISYTLKHLKKWAAPRRVKTPVSLQPGTSYIYRDPLGAVLIIGPWNYPFNLTLSPLVGAIAAGNTVLVKPSEVSAATSGLIRDLIGRYFDPSYIAVAEGGAEETAAILEHRFDHIFYTGGERVGKIVMAAAAKHLTPVTLELGGKSPCIVDKDIDFELAARRISWGKFMNAGQTCVASDYLLVHETVKSTIVEAFRGAIKQFFGENPQTSPFFGRIVNEQHFNRLCSLMKHGDVILGGVTDSQSRYVAPTLLHNVKPEDPIMTEEIFGPLLPIITYKTLDDAIGFINARPKPLALYVFSNDEALKKRVLSETSSGGACINNTLFHITSTELPFGGVGPSGMGSYHGKASFDTFSHAKSVLKHYPLFNATFLYPPYKPYLRWILKAIS